MFKTSVLTPKVLIILNAFKNYTIRFLTCHNQNIYLCKVEEKIIEKITKSNIFKLCIFALVNHSCKNHHSPFVWSISQSVTASKTMTVIHYEPADHR